MPTYIDNVSADNFSELCSELKSYSPVSPEYFDRFEVKRRLRKMKEKLLIGKLSYKNIENSYKSWKYTNKKYKVYKALKRLDKYFNKLFVFERTAWII